ncbi:hypothetical protein QWJ07_05200 [Frankia sp. RB7]|nr:hypothetical protein [Frankia sp. RB7]
MRSDQEIRAATATIKEGAKILYESPEARDAAWGLTKYKAGDFWDDELNRYHLAGRMVFGFFTELAPVANIGDATRALENKHNTFDAIMTGITGNRPKQ